MEDLEAAGIRLRRFRDDDAEAFAAGTRDPDVRAHSGLPSEHTPQSARSAFRLFDDPTFLQRAIADARTDALLGTVILFSFVRHERRCEVGFWLLPAGRGRGAATTAVGLACEWAQHSWGVERFDAHSDADNPAAHAVLERNGFEREGLLRGWGVRRGRRVDAFVFGRLVTP
ncbi:MAG TPA: GNAT family protein [Solirubrobacteraceae bacterium]|jgi:RimJ/RimL family protein N-acetyltransferase|nr:GNAT family protein [Solirubrobacteraceae bacterium]